MTTTFIAKSKYVIVHNNNIESLENGIKNMSGYNNYAKNYY